MGDGGGLYIEDGNVNLLGVLIHSNLAKSGGGLYISGGQVAVEGSRISANVAVLDCLEDNGSESNEYICAFASDGVCDDGGSGSETALCIIGTDCVDCGARPDLGKRNPSGGGVTVDGGEASFRGTLIHGNVAYGVENVHGRRYNGMNTGSMAGAGILITQRTEEATLTDCQIFENNASALGGGLGMSNSRFSWQRGTTITNSSF